VYCKRYNKKEAKSIIWTLELIDFISLFLACSVRDSKERRCLKLCAF